MFWEFNSIFHSSHLKDFKVFLVLRVWGKLFQSLAVLTAKVRPPSEMFLWRGDSKFKLQFLVILAWLFEFFLRMSLNSAQGSVPFILLKVSAQRLTYSVCFIVKREPA